MPQHPLTRAMSQDSKWLPQDYDSRHGSTRDGGLGPKPSSRASSPGSASASRSRSPRRKADGPLASVCAEDDLEGGDASLSRLRALEAKLPADACSRLQQLVEEGTISRGSFDLDALTAFASLTQELQEKVLRYLESERLFLMNARSKSGFLKAACDRARNGSLDAKGIGLPDPWRPALIAIAVPKRAQIDLVPESQWVEQLGMDPAHMTVDVSADGEVGVSSITLAMLVTQPVVAVKHRLAAIGVKIPVHKMQLKEGTVGFLKNDKSLAFYNIKSGSLLHLVYKTRGGVALRRDHSVQGHTA